MWEWLTSIEWSWVVAALSAFALVLVLAYLWVRGKLRRWRRALIHRRARLGEQDAGPLLERNGYTVVARKSRQRCFVLVNGKRRSFTVEPDYVVQRRGKRFIADAKTGGAASIGNSGTRRQLLEYSLAMECDGVLLVDMERRKIQEIEFTYDETR